MVQAHLKPIEARGMDPKKIPNFFEDLELNKG